ncbi:MAG: plasmid pRiA4b ORF-3 family protein [bacterium]
MFVEKLLPVVSGRRRYPMLTGGKRACPPEDCGGVPGYYHLLDVLENPNHPEHEELLEWSGGEYEPEKFNIQEVNRAFHGGWGPTRPHI